MNDTSVKLVQLDTPPPGVGEEDHRRWQAGLGDLMIELKLTARKLIGRWQSPAVLRLLDVVQSCQADPVGFGLVEHVYEFTAFHAAGRSGQTIAECAAGAAEHLPEHVRGYLPPLAASHWDLYEIEGYLDGGAIGLRRLHDDQRVALDAMEAPQPLVVGTVQALRVFDAGGFRAAPIALVLDQANIAELVNRLEIEQPGAFADRTEYMRGCGSDLILRHALADHIGRLSGGRIRPEPSVSLAESSLSHQTWMQLDDAFSLLEVVIGERLTALNPLVLVTPRQRVVRIEQNGRTMAVMIFDSPEQHRQWDGTGQAEPFVRAWRASADELFCEDVEFLDGLGLRPERDGAVVAIRQEDGMWEDVADEHVDEVVEACRWAAMRISSDGFAAA